MKTSKILYYIKFIIIITLFIVIGIFSCQQEIVTITPPDDKETLKSDSPLSTLISRAVMKDGSEDNIIDTASCLEIKLPVTVIVNSVETIVNSVEDYETVEAILEQFITDTDTLEIKFPITIITSDFSEIVINNSERLKEFANTCNGENEEDYDIECIDFVYPVSISIFNTSFDIIQAEAINSDIEFFKFLRSLNNDIIFSLNFPLNVLLADNSEITINNNPELETTINAAINSCDEDDDFDYNDDEENCNIQPVADNLNRNSWKLTEYSSNSQLENHQLKFHTDFTFSILNDGVERVSGEWSAIQSYNRSFLNLIVDFEDFNGEWEIVQCDENFLQLKRNNDFMEIVICQNYEIDPDVLRETVLDCKWFIVGFEKDNIDLTNDFLYLSYEFKEDGNLIFSGGNVVLETTWEIETLSSGLVNLKIPSPITNITETYEVKSLNDEEIELEREEEISQNSTSREISRYKMKLERNCD